MFPGKDWRWPHQLKRPRTGWLSYTIWALKVAFWCGAIRDRGGLSVGLELWRWLNPFRVKVK
jgi:hypothetical protein